MKLQLPDGRIIEIPTDDEGQAKRLALRFYKENPAPEKKKGFFEGVAEGAMGQAKTLLPLGAEALAGAGRGIANQFETLTGINSPARAEMLSKMGIDQKTAERDVLPQKGEFAGEGLATDVAATAGEFGGQGAALGGLVGKAPAIAEAATSAVSGGVSALAGELGEAVAGEKGRSAFELAGGIAGGAIAGNSMINKNTLSEKIKDSNAKKVLRSAAPTSNELKNVGREIYKDIDNLGAFFKAEDLSNMAKEITEEMTDFGISKGGQRAAFDVMNEILEGATKNQTAKGLDGLRKMANNLRGDPNDSIKEAGRRMTSIIDDFMDKVNPISAKTGKPLPEINSKYKDARKIWRQAIKADLIEDAFDMAGRQASGVENGLRIKFNALLNNKKTKKIWSKEEKAAMEKVIKGGFLENTARHLGTFGFSVDQARNWLGSTSGIAAGASVGGPVGAVAVPTLGTLSKLTAGATTRKNAELAKALVSAGNSGKETVKAYLRNVPSKQQNREDLSEILSKKVISKKELQEFTKNMSTTKKKLIMDAAFLSAAFGKDQEQE